MVLKDKNTKFNFEITKTKEKEGLKESDNWCLCKTKIERNNKVEEYEKEAISYHELQETIKEIEVFLKEKKCYQKRSSYIKNYIILFFSLKKKNKTIKIRLVHPKKNKNNIEIILEDKEIEEFREELKKQEDKIKSA